MSDTALIIERRGTHLVRYVDTYEQDIYLHEEGGRYFCLTPDEFALVAKYVKDQRLERTVPGPMNRPGPEAGD